MKVINFLVRAINNYRLIIKIYIIHKKNYIIYIPYAVRLMTSIYNNNLVLYTLVYILITLTLINNIINN